MSESGKPVVRDRLQLLVLSRLAALGTAGHPMSARRAAARSGGAVSHHTLYAIANGEHSGRISDRVAMGLAVALDVPVEHVYEAAGAPRPQTRWSWPDRFDRIAPEHRPLFEDLASAFLEAERRGYERGRREN